MIKNAVIDACDDAKCYDWIRKWYTADLPERRKLSPNSFALRRLEIWPLKASVIPEVRAKLLELQRSLAREKDVIMDGRDIGTNILPDADVKIYLTASVGNPCKTQI